MPAFAAFVCCLAAEREPQDPGVSAWYRALGVAQYLFIMLRTYQQAPHLEASARTLRELVDVMRATR